MTTFAPTDWRQHAAELCQPRPRRHRTPGDLARALDHTTRDSLALQVIDRELVNTADHLVPAEGLMIFSPPQEGKASGSAAVSPNGCWPTTPPCASRSSATSRKWRSAGAGRSCGTSAAPTNATSTSRSCPTARPLAGGTPRREVEFTAPASAVP